jgi:hypothetical protein
MPVNFMPMPGQQAPAPATVIGPQAAPGGMGGMGGGPQQGSPGQVDLSQLIQAMMLAKMRQGKPAPPATQVWQNDANLPTPPGGSTGGVMGPP